MERSYYILHSHPFYYINKMYNNKFTSFIAILVIVGAAVYPIGWDNRELRESCGNESHIYILG